MADVVIHRCTLRVVRRGGWSWGPNPRRLLQEVMRTFPALLARKLAELVPEEDDRECAAPIQVRLPIRMDDLLRAPASWSDFAPPGGAGPLTSLEQRMELAISTALGLRAEPQVEEPHAGRFPRVQRLDEESIRNSPNRHSALHRLLQVWREQGVLEHRLTLLSAEDIASWHNALERNAGGAPKIAAEPDQVLAERIEAFVRAQVDFVAGSDRAARLRRRVFIAAEIAALHAIPMDSASLWRVLDRILPVEDSSSPRPMIADALAGTFPITEKGTHDVRPEDVLCQRAIAIEPRQPKETARRTSTDWEVQIACALPFLLLGPLSRLGYLETLSAVLEAADLSDEAPLFAAALAHKVLDPPERGWCRSPASQQAAAAFAGMQTVPEEALVDFARRIAPHTGPLDVVLADGVVQGHTSGDPVLLRPTDVEGTHGFMLIDVPGCFPIAWAADLESLLPLLLRFDSSVVLVPSEGAEPQLFGELNAAGVSFLTDAPPTRQEPWRRIQQGPSLLGWTNDQATPSMEPLLRAARGFAAARADADALWQALAVARPGVVHARSSAFDRSLTLAAGVATGLIAWELWRERGRTTPQLTVERFCDLDARVRFGPESILVRLPLGRRHQELLECGLLAPVDDVPWLDGVRIEFGGG